VSYEFSDQYARVKGSAVAAFHSAAQRMAKPKSCEVCFFGRKILVPFADGMMALLEPGPIRQLAAESNAITPLPDEIPS